MMPSARLLLAVTALCCLAIVSAVPMDGFSTDHKCRCLTTTSDPISPRHFQRIEIIPPSAYCRTTEILITLKNNNTVCVSPDATWVKVLLSKIIQRSKKLVASPSPSSTN
ncbi:hypothetical protein NFI96_011214 [Prochilodus magdalenae]|nr:hypothetical protein NFI96_011214 [Prochilodus magdalenae]